MDNLRFTQVVGYIEKGQYPSLDNETLTNDQYENLMSKIKFNIEKEESEDKKMFLDGYLSKVSVDGIAKANIEKIEKPIAKPNPRASQKRKP